MSDLTVDDVLSEDLKQSMFEIAWQHGSIPYETSTDRGGGIIGEIRVLSTYYPKGSSVTLVREADPELFEQKAKLVREYGATLERGMRRLIEEKGK